MQQTAPDAGPRAIREASRLQSVDEALDQPIGQLRRQGPAATAGWSSMGGSRKPVLGALPAEGQPEPTGPRPAVLACVCEKQPKCRAAGSPPLGRHCCCAPWGTTAARQVSWARGKSKPRCSQNREPKTAPWNRVSWHRCSVEPRLESAWRLASPLQAWECATQRATHRAHNPAKLLVHESRCVRVGDDWTG